MQSTLTNAEKEWILNLVKKELKPPKTLKARITIEPKSQVQAILKEIYNRLLTTDTADEFDQFYAERLADYKQRYRVFNILNQYVQGFGRIPDLDYDSERSVQAYLFSMTERTLEEPQTLSRLRDIINEKYPGLVLDIPEMSEEQVLDQANDFTESLVTEIREKLENGLTLKDCDLEEHLSKIQKTKGQIEKMATQLNTIILIGVPVWELILYAILSPFAPPFQMNGINKRTNIHTMLCGDLSTAKSEVLEILEELSPREYRMDNSTIPSFEGISLPDGSYKPGIVDIANNGILLIHEFDKILRDFPMMRRYMDCKEFRIHKRGEPKDTDINITYMTGSNPKEDFFFKEIFRKQIPFTEGVLSRFDVLIPLTSTAEKNKVILEKLELFGGQQYDFREFKETLDTIVSGIVTLTSVKISEEQQQLLKTVFKAHNIELAHRPLLLLRDMETMCRLVNVIVCTNILERKIDNGSIYAEDEDIIKAITLWEDLIYFRKMIYLPNSGREIYSIEDHIKKALAMNENVTRKDLKKIIVDNLKLCCQATLYNKVNKLIARGKVSVDGLRDGVLTLT